MNKNFLVVALSVGALVVGAQSASALAGAGFAGMAPMAEATATALPAPNFGWQTGQGGAGQVCAAPVTQEVRVSGDLHTGDVRTGDIRTGDVRRPGCGFRHGHHGHGRGLGSHDVRTGDSRMTFDLRHSFDARGSFDVRSGDSRPGHHFGKPVSGDFRPMPPVFTGDVRGPKPGMGMGRGHGHGNGGDGDNQGFVPPAGPAPAVTASATPVTGAGFQQGQQRLGGPRQGGRPRGNH